jgi:hypothetical protein
MARQIVHYDDVTGLQFGHKNLRHVSLEPIAVDRAIQYHRRDHAGHAQSGDQRGGLAVLVGEPSAVARLSAAPMASGHVGGGPGLICSSSSEMSFCASQIERTSAARPSSRRERTSPPKALMSP